MQTNLQLLTDSLVLQYSYFVEIENLDTPWRTPVHKFEADIQKLINNNFKSISLKQAMESRINPQQFHEKTFCVGLWGGYLNNYTLAFPILKKYNVKAAIFLNPNIIENPDILTNEEHLSWANAQTMIDSGLIDIYPLWDNNASGSSFATEIQRKIELLRCKLERNDPSYSVAFNTKELDIYSSHYLKKLGFRSHISYRYNISDDDVMNGRFLSFRVDPDVDVIDIHNLITKICEMNFVKATPSPSNHPTYRIPNKSCYDESIILPIELNPIVKNYMRHAVPLSIIQAYSKTKAEIYALTECIEVVFKPWDYWYDYHNYSYEYWQSLEFRKITRDILEINNINIIDYIIKGLKAQYYCDIWLDTYYIPKKVGYKKEHRTHGILIYGFDASEYIFKAAAYTERGYFESFDVKVDEIALGCSTQYFVCLNLLGNNCVEQTSYDICLIYQKLNNYINSNISDDNYRFVPRGKNQYYNYNASLCFSETVSAVSKEHHTIPSTMMYSYVEHKRLMAWRISTIVSKEHLNICCIDDEVSTLRLNLERALNLSVKFNIKPSEHVRTSIVNLIDEINNMESSLINKVLTEIKSKYRF